MTTTTSPPPPSAEPGTPTPPSRWLAAVSGVLSAAAGLGVGELLSSLAVTWPSPVIAVGDVVIDNSPQPVTKWAIDTFGTNDKLVLVIGIMVLLGLTAAGLGILVQRRPGAALLGVLAFGAVGAGAILYSPIAGIGALIPVLGITVTSAVALLVLASGLANRPPPGLPAPADGALAPIARRRFLLLASVVTVGGAAAAAAGRFLVSGFDVDGARSALSLPGPAEQVDLPVPDDAMIDVEGVEPYLTSNAGFYRIDINLELPRIDPDAHVLRITGMVDRPLAIPFNDLLRRDDLIDIPITMTCVSYEIGGDLVGNAVWRGVRLRTLLDEAGVQDRADQVVGRSVDDYTCGFPVAAAYDREALVVVGMNGDPLPLEHGFPLRLITPGIYGYVGATKWLAEIELTRFDEFDQYWVPRGYAAQAPIKIQSRIDTPAGLAQLSPGPVPIAGTAWAQTRGLERVEVQIDDGDWEDAELATAVNDVTWVQWRYEWDAIPGRHTIRVRATDGTGEVQTDERTGVIPDGVAGQHSIPVSVSDD